MLVVSGAGLTSSLGDLVSACAAARAGVTRRLPLGLVLPNPGQEDAAELKGHAAPEVAGTEDYGRLVALLVPALREALGGDPTLVRDQRTRVYVVLPPDEDRGALLDVDEDELPLGGDGLVQERLCELVMPELDPARIRVVRAQHAGVIELLGQLNQELTRRMFDRAIVCAADSLVDLATVEGLAAVGRLRHAASPDGLYPGEAGVALVVELQQFAERRGARVLAEIGAAAYHPGPPARAAAAPARGQEEPDEPAWSLEGSALADAITALEHADPQALQAVAGLVDEFNGESVRARHLWTNLLQSGSRSAPLRRLAQLPRWSPAEVFGDVGAATGALHLCVSLRAFARDYAPGTSLLVCNTSDSGAAGAMVVSAPPKAT